MAIPINSLSDRRNNYKSTIDFLSLRNNFAIPQKYTICLKDKPGCNNTKDDYKDLHMGVWEKLISSTAWTNPLYTVSGDEPLLYPEICELISRLCDSGDRCRIEIITSGRYLSSYIDQISKNNIKLIININSNDTPCFENFNKNDAFGFVAELLYYLKKSSPDTLEKLCLNYILTPDNIYEAHNIIEIAKGYTIDRLTFHHTMYSLTDAYEMTNNVWSKYLDEKFQPDIQFHNKYIFTDAYIKKVMLLTKNVSEGCGDKLNIEFFPNLDGIEVKNYYSKGNVFLDIGDNRCLKPWINPTIYGNGDVEGCCGMVLGNINEQSFWQLWNGERNQKLRKQLITRDNFPFCTLCQHFYEKYTILKRGASDE